MDPKVSGKLLTTHRRGYGVDVEALHGRFPLRQSAVEGSKMGSRGYRRLRRWKLFLLAPWMFSGYMGIYRRTKYVGGRPRGPRDRGVRPTGGAAPYLMGPSEASWLALQALRISFVSKITLPKVSFRLDSVWYSFSSKYWNRQKKQQYGMGLSLVG